MNNNALIQIEGVTKRFGGLLALDDVSLSVKGSEIFGIIGPNGAGKSTLLAQISGLQQPTSGKIVFDNHDITGMEAHEIAHLGIGRNFQASLLFKELSVLENVFTGYHMVYKTNMLKRFFRLSSARNEEQELREKATEILDFMGLGSVKDELAKNLPHGYQRILTICIAMATAPKLLLLDEPVTGMNQTEMNIMVDLIWQIRDRGITIMLIEHNMETIMKVCDRIMVLNYGEKIAEGTPKEIQNNPQVVEAYLGKE